MTQKRFNEPAYEILYPVGKQKQANERKIIYFYHNMIQKLLLFLTPMDVMF